MILDFTIFAIAVVQIVIVIAMKKQEQALIRDIERMKQAISHNTDCLFDLVSQSRRDLQKVFGKLEKALQQSSISEKFAQRAFGMASQANVTMASIANLLQRRPAPLSNKDLAKNEEIKRKLQDVFGESEFEFIKPLLSDDELELLDDILEKRRKAAQ